MPYGLRTFCSIALKAPFWIVLSQKTCALIDTGKQYDVYE